MAGIIQKSKLIIQKLTSELLRFLGLERAAFIKIKQFFTNRNLKIEPSDSMYSLMEWRLGHFSILISSRDLRIIKTYMHNRKTSFKQRG